MSIKPIPQDVIAQIKSSAAIVSLNGVVCELMRNSLDAGSTRIDIVVDYSRGDCVVEDDGSGIPPADFSESGGLGRLYHTSKTDQKHSVHGYCGAFLASLSSMALVTITSHHHLYRSQNTLRMHKSEVVSRQTPAPAQQHLASSAHGTRVTVQNLFGSMPVRVKQRALAGEKNRGYSKDWEELRSHTILLLLAWPEKVSFAINGSEVYQRMAIKPSYNTATFTNGGGVNSSAVCSTLAQAGYITLGEKASWVSVSASTPYLRIDGSICLDPCATKNLQFISFGILPVSGAGRETVLHEEINRLFLNSSFGNKAEAIDRNKRTSAMTFKESGFTKRELNGGRKGVERWPMFYINVHRSDRPQHLDNEKLNEILDEKANSLGPILELLRMIVLAFLTKHHFQPREFRSHSSKSVREIIGDISDGTSEQLGSISNRISSASPVCKMSSSVLLQNMPSMQDLHPVPSQIDNGYIDHLRTRIKLPSFRRSIETPFDTWSRVKSGSAKPVFEKHNGLKLSNPGSIRRPFSASPKLKNPEVTVINTSSPATRSARSSPSLLSKSGKLIRQPFEEVMARPLPSKPPSPQKQSYGRVGTSDESLIWVNPATKVRSVLNSRTGLTRPENLCRANQRSHPLPITGGSRLISRPSLRGIASSTPESPGPWISDILKNWNNPVFQACEQEVPQISFETYGDPRYGLSRIQHRHCNHDPTQQGSMEASPATSGRISKDALENAEIVSQVDKKFILLKLDASGSPTISDSKSLLVIVDQHAADERVRIESLMDELCTPSTDSDTGIRTTSLDRPMTFEIYSREVDILRAHACHFAEWGIIYSVTDHGTMKVSNPKETSNSSSHLVVRSLPPGILERCKLDPKVLIELIRSEAWKVNRADFGSPNSGRDVRLHQTWLEKIPGCPQGILDLLNSRACRSAIMFNDELSRSQCEALVSKLTACIFPFQCAHGRPSMVPLVDLGPCAEAPPETGTSQVCRSDGFGPRFRQWKEGDLIARR